MKYPINEMFVSVQGEGCMVGAAMVFVRLSGCNLSCSWCDTAHEHFDSELSPEEIKQEISRLTKGLDIRYCCVTGGEPTIYPLKPLFEVIVDLKMRAALETNGTRKLGIGEHPYILTVSPKWPPGVEEVAIRAGTELKVPVGAHVTDQQLVACKNFGAFGFRFVQPVDTPDEDQFKENVRRSLDFVNRNSGWRVSGQMHKRLKLR